MKKVSMATAGAAFLTLMSVTTASAAILSGSGTISGIAYPVDRNSEGAFSFFRGINTGDPISGSFSFSYDDLIFNTTTNSVDIPLNTFKLSIGSSPLIFPITPLVRFIKSGNSFVFNGVFGEVRPSREGSRDFIVLNNNSLFFLLDIRTSAFILTSDPDRTIFPNEGIQQTCQGTGCSFTPNSITSVPENTSILGLLTFGLLGISLVSKQHKVRKN